MSIMELKQVGYSYDNKRKVLKGINAEMEQGKLYAILGPSGCGKTTLLSLIGGLDSPAAVRFILTDRILPKPVWATTEKTMWRSSSRRTT